MPRDLDRVIARCLRKDPERRWQAMADLKVAPEEVREDPGQRGNTAPRVSIPAHRSYGGRFFFCRLPIVAIGALAFAARWIYLCTPPVNAAPDAADLGCGLDGLSRDFTRRKVRRLRSDRSGDGNLDI